MKREDSLSTEKEIAHKLSKKLGMTVIIKPHPNQYGDYRRFDLIFPTTISPVSVVGHIFLGPEKIRCISKFRHPSDAEKASQTEKVLKSWGFSRLWK